MNVGQEGPLEGPSSGDPHKQFALTDVDQTSVNGPSFNLPSGWDYFASDKIRAAPVLPPKSFVPLVVLNAEMRDKLRRYQRRSIWLPGLIDRLVLSYPFPFEGEVTTCPESENPPRPTMDLVLQTKQSKNQIHPLIRVYRVQSERFSSELIVKISDTWTVNYRRNEAMSLALIRELTNIPVPRILQVSQAGDESGGTGTVFLATEYIPGRTLEECWHSLGFFTKARIIWTLRNYVAQLRRLKRTTPGPLNRSQVFEGHYVSHQGAGPFETYEDMIHWFNRRIEIGNKRAVQKCDMSSFTASGPLVFSHQDLCLRNILLGDDDVLYVLDWEWAGFYPEWLELAGMTRYSDQPWSFRIFIPFICGSSHTENLKRLAAAGWAIHVGFLLQ